ncbi:hypothetical protein L1987_14341 [Smallanthus sonchifolius]|uniref:Uncharacterized protein n=1 Tax=Smallanthus sonchifolius TaxID=185202 RepID=A0ACB9J3K0_9ASTR|nr:hypothetical protein L1987_14341 [Smallanthus sonchifolius]
MESKSAGESLMMSFDVESEDFKEIRFPPNIPCECMGESLVALNGCIHLCVAYGDIHKGLKCDLWRMDGDGWIKVAAFFGPCSPFSRRIHIRTGNWLAILEDSFKNIDMEDWHLVGAKLASC